MSADPYDDPQDDDEWGNVNCQPVFIDADDEDADPAQANGDAPPPPTTWRDWT